MSLKGIIFCYEYIILVCNSFGMLYPYRVTRIFKVSFFLITLNLSFSLNVTNKSKIFLCKDSDFRKLIFYFNILIF